MFRLSCSKTVWIYMAFEHDERTPSVGPDDVHNPYGFRVVFLRSEWLKTHLFRNHLF